MNTNLNVTADTKIEVMSPAGLKAVRGGFIGFFVDMFDIYLPIVAMAPAMIYFLPKGLPDNITNTIFYLTMAITLLGRPVGAAIFGHFGDKIGRKKTTLITIVGFGIVTLLIGLLPGHETLGLGAIFLLIFLRFLDGVFLGGEYTTAIPLAMEYSPKRLRGFFSGLIISGMCFAYIAVSIITAILLKYMPSGDLHSQYVQYGWRIPFIVGSLIAVWFYFYFKNNVQESEKWESSEKAKAPLLEVLRGKNLRDFLQVFIMMSGIWFYISSILYIVPGLLINILKIPALTVTNVIIVVYVGVALAFMGGGALSQVIGRRRLMIIVGILGFTIVPYIYYCIVKYGISMSLVNLTLMLILLFCIPESGTFSLVSAYINERFKSGVRASAFGLGYSSACIIPSFYSFYMLGLSKVMPYEYTQIVLMVIGGILLTIGAFMGPETKDVEL